ncbi:enoyl-CoA hydratase [Altererythrobacter salegens]|uniref:Enoyl-CoA hydratase n=1 Tax=Croceibacterium salegens TaxID=1737568 RepID=A0A6I4SYZ8_9SPHN|nr:enoyl-CoA hydratase-related protein [Croceibacterium salegens]MXO60658.1 enoyl-CoA hydratase [Croceibacterium salegens]
MDTVLYEIARPHVALVTINRPDARNAVNSQVAIELDAAVKRAERDPDVWAVVLTGAGGVAFSAGADLKEVANGNIDGLYTPEGQFAGFVKHKREKAWIAAVEGFALAGGCELALACDMIVASEPSSFALPEVTRGLVAAAGGVYRLVRAIPKALALELIATGDRISAQRAADLGLINAVTPAGDALAGALTLAERICANAPIAVRESLNVARMALDLDDDELFERGLAAQDNVRTTVDFKEGPRAFVEKRAPIWTGR